MFSFHKIFAWKKVLINFPVKQNNKYQLLNDNKPGREEGSALNCPFYFDFDHKSCCYKKLNLSKS